MADKYALRPRSLRQQHMPAAPERPHPHLAPTPVPVPAHAPVPVHAHAPAPAPSDPAPAPGARTKQKPAPLSKYRRKTANARERSRMREINVAFETLRRAVPHVAGAAGAAAAAACASEKLTKITTLRLAMRYIAALSQAVREREREREAELLMQCAPPPHPLHPPGHFVDPDTDLLGGELFSDTPLADLVDPCLTAVALTSDDFYDSPFVSDFS